MNAPAGVKMEGMFAKALRESGEALLVELQSPMALEYMRRLKVHDWTHEFSDDRWAWRRGSDDKAWLKAQAKLIDPHGAVWNLFAPAGYDFVK